MTVEVLPLSRLMAVTLAPLFTLTLPAFTFNVLTVIPLPRTNYLPQLLYGRIDGFPIDCPSLANRITSSLLRLKANLS